MKAVRSRDSTQDPLVLSERWQFRMKSLALLKRNTREIRARLPLEKGEVKGRLLNKWQIDEVVTLLARNEVLFEGTAIDLGMHTEQAVHDYKKQHGEEM